MALRTGSRCCKNLSQEINSLHKKYRLEVLQEFILYFYRLKVLQEFILYL